ncbi:MAG TPA: cyanophycinase [Terracidiphilus sp.]|jgi:cyanophycinase|nr:cyanophycinase [Terracidiphilus sp.]
MDLQRGVLRILFFLLVLTAPVAAQTTPYRYFRVGNTEDHLAQTKSGFALMGGSTDLDEAFRFLCQRAGGGDFLVLRAHGNDEYNTYIQRLCPLNSVATLVIPNREAANMSFVAEKIHNAGGLFIAGGDQANYINFWMDTPVQAALNDAIHHGVPIGGTSAGLAVLGEYAYTAQGDQPDDPNLDGKTAIADPFGARITLVHGFLDIAPLKGVVTDTHFATRKRMGRMLVFLARLNAAESEPGKVRGIGVEQRAAVLLEPNGKGQVVGHGNAYFVEPKQRPSVLKAGNPLALTGIEVQKVPPGHSFDIRQWRGDATTYTLNIENGTIQSTQPGGSVY